MSGRLWLASLLVALAIGAPLSAWYATGMRDIDHEWTRIKSEARLEAQNRADDIAKRVSQRLELLRRIESRRAADDWNGVRADDPLIARSFESRDAAMLQSVDRQVRALRKALPKEVTAPPVLFNTSQSATLNVNVAMPVIENKRMGELTWRTFGSELIALRPVVTRRDAYVQGFAVSTAALAERGSELHATRISEEPTTHAIAPIAGTTWTLTVDERDAIAALLPGLERRRHEFRTTFAAAAGAGLLALIAIVAFLRKSEQLALERARFAAAAAHELRTPLAALRLYGDMLAENLGDPSRAAEYARRISEESERLGRVVANVLDFSRLEKGALQIHPERDDLANAVESCIAALRPAIACDVRLHVEGELPRVAVDRDALFHITQNLLDNAERYSRASADRTIDVSVGRDNGGVALSVADRGTGMNGRKPRHRESGLGLGLAIADALSRAHGGKLAWQPRDGGGTVFKVVFPA